MADLIVLGYKPGKTTLHGLDIRCKLFILVLMNILAFNASLRYLILVFLPLAILFVRLKIPLKATLYQLRLFFLLLLFVFVARAVSIEGDTLLETPLFTITYQGVGSAVLYCWRLVLALIGGILFVSTSKTGEIKAAMQWFLKPLPLVPERRVAIMISLMIRFLPLILEQGQEISEAQKVRAVERVKNPVKRLSLYSIPLLRRVFETADRLVLAMEARSYTESRTDPVLRFKALDMVVLVVATAFTVVSFVV